MPFIRGHVNADDSLDIGDAVYLLSYFFAEGPDPVCEDAADANDDGALDMADPITILSFLFKQTLPLPSPYPEAGLDPTEDSLESCL